MTPRAVDVLVALPANDEQQRITKTLESVLAAVRSARLRGAVGSACVAVAAHRCRDQTAARARAVLDAAPDVTALVWETSGPGPVGAVRSELIRRATAAVPLERAWLFSTDADTSVPGGWIVDGLRLAATAGAAMVIGLVDLDESEVDPLVRVAHDRLIRAGLHTDGSHEHVYAANLAIRLDAYRDSGGFPAVLQGEEHALLSAVRVAGYPVLTTPDWRVRTSARLRGRARGGLGDLLGRLAGVDQLDRSA